MMKKLIRNSFLLTSILTCAPAISGLQVGATRIVYPSNSDEVQLTVQSKNTSTNHLVQAWVSNIDDQGDAPFIATPPLMKLGAGQETIFHFIYAKKGAELPKDRESVFWANIKFIASTPENMRDQSKLQIASRTRIKLFYRPTSLKDNEAFSAYEKINFSRQGNALNITNPTPFYVTFNSITVDGKPVTAPKDTLTAMTMMVAPYGHISLPAALKANSVIKWNAISDYGSATPSKESVLK